jgi:hypothetical protein
MEFNEWCERIFARFKQLYARAGINRTVGLGEYDIATVTVAGIGPLTLYQAPAYEGFRAVLLTTLSELSDAALLDEQNTHGYYKPSDIARKLGDDLTPLWQAFCNEELDSDEAELLRVLATLSERQFATYADIDWVGHDALISALAWPEGMDRVYPVAEELKRRNLIGFSATMGPAFRAHITYRSLIWLRKQGETLEAQFIDSILAEGETTSIEIKREQHTDTNDQKAELVKDLLSLVNTKASGDRWLIIGFDDKTRSWYSPPDPKLNQNHLEQILAMYTEPVIDIRFETTVARGQAFAKIHVLRDATKLPYRVKKGLRGEKRQIHEQQVFVRHGSQVEEPTPLELDELIEEGNRARS